MTQIEKEKVQKYMGSYGHWRFGFSTEEELIRSLRSAVVLMEQCYILLDAALLMMSLQNFASLGGTNMFLAGQVSAEDATQVLDWIDKAVQEVRQHIVRIADIGQGGWSNLRRKKKTSWFSHPGPLDNMRLAMNIEEITHGFATRTILRG
ncbi:Transmembrane protein 107 [Durusdinium trenchii]|uniref:Transmembrane protein 107 n=1 Tax=Durusdinium trenchii TaxID=1381693 RepID=A0ABP0QIG5_9DINO